MERRVAFTDVGQVCCETFESPDLGAQQLRIRSRCSLISSGTESIVLHKRYSPGSHWDRWVNDTYPFYPGYACIGEVVEVGCAVGGWAVGERVALRAGHASEHVVDAHAAVRVPAGISDEDAAWFALAKIAFMGARVAEIGLGVSMVVIGAGPVGQMAIRWSLAAGVEPLVVIDPAGERCALAATAGQLRLLPRTVAPGDEEVLRCCGGHPPAVVMDTTGNAAVFATALGLAGRGGQVVLLGDTGNPELQHLSSDVMQKGLRITAGHDCHCDATWTEERIIRLFFDLVAGGRFRLDGLISHRFTADTAAQAYDLLEERRGDSMGLLIDWSAA